MDLLVQSFDFAWPGISLAFTNIVEAVELYSRLGDLIIPEDSDL